MINHAIQTDVRKRPLDTPVQKRVLQTLAALADENGEVYRSIPDIAARALACPRTVLRVLHELADQGEILILSSERVRGHYRINSLPDNEKPPVDSLRMPIADAIRLLPLPVRVSVIFQALSKYASRTGNNIFPSVRTLMRDTGYSKQIVQETLRWLLQTNFIAPDDCVNPNYQMRTGYKIPGWHPLSPILTIDKAQIEQIKALYRRRHRGYWGDQEEEAGQDESNWLEDHSFDFDEYNLGNTIQLDDDEGEELGGEASTEEPVSAQQNPQEVEAEEEDAAPLPFLKPETPPSDMIRAVLAPHRRNTAISLKSYHAAIEAMQLHLDLIEAHESGEAPVDEATLKKSRTIINFYQRTIDTYEQQFSQRE